MESNSELYGGAKEFLTELNSLSAGVLNDLLSHLKYLGDQRQLKAQGKLSLDIFWQIVTWGDVSQMGNLALNLWNLAKQGLDPGTKNKAIESLRKRAQSRKEIETFSAKIET